VLTGDTLFVGDVGRPDLRVALGWSAAELGGKLYDLLHIKFLPLRDATLVYPTHGAGSLCGKALSRETVPIVDCVEFASAAGNRAGQRGRRWALGLGAGEVAGA
jgi:glyoxylase-like metal-dependent hydrolase (beta-lactamase superfamily II)